MKTRILATLTMALAISGAAAFAQENSATVKPVHASSSRPLIVTGKVSNDGRSIVTDIDSEWSISNADALRGHEGRMVTVKCFVDTEKNLLQVLTVRPAKSDVNYASRQADSAFRR